MRHDLRNLADQLREVTRGHACHSLAWPIVSACADHLCAIANIHELHAAAEKKESPFPELSPTEKHFQEAQARVTAQVMDPAAHWESVKHLYLDTNQPKKALKIEQQ